MIMQRLHEDDPTAHVLNKGGWYHVRFQMEFAPEHPDYDPPDPVNRRQSFPEPRRGSEAMTSSFAWLDYSEQERRRALDVISLFQIRDTRDELGLAGVRDPLAELLFPGTTTIQTRARYFLFIPWMCRDFERRAVRSSRIGIRFRSAEGRLIKHLSESDDVKGVIGGEAGAAVKRMPSSVYWAGLRRWGILQFQGSQAQYHRSLDQFYVRLKGRQARDRENEASSPEPTNWHPHIPDPPAGFPEGAELRLRFSEAEYLRERILSAAPCTLLAHLVDQVEEPWDRVGFAWEHVAAAEFPTPIRRQLTHTRIFSEVMHGASLLYNLMLAEARGHEDWIDTYTSSFEQWAVEEAERAERLAAWDLGAFWDLVSGGGRPPTLTTRRFVEGWADRVRRASALGSLRSDPNALRLVRDREHCLKRGRARLHNRRHLELWRGASGSAQLDFRWGITQTLLHDILDGLSSRTG